MYLYYDLNYLNIMILMRLIKQVINISYVYYNTKSFFRGLCALTQKFPSLSEVCIPSKN